MGVLVAACTDGTDWQDVPVEQLSKVARIEVPIAPPRELGILFVIDRSPAMRDFEANLVANYPRFIGALDTVVGGRPSLHLAVTTSDPLDDGTFHVPADGRVDGEYLVDERRPDGIRVNNYDGSLADAFAAAAMVGTDGSATSQPLAMAQRAIERHPWFARADGDLMIVILTAQDDASPGTLDEHARAFARYVSSPERLVIAAAIGPETGTCAYDGAVATASPRLHALLARFPNRHTDTTICQPDLSSVMQLLGGLATLTIADPCFEVPVTADRCASWLGFANGRPDLVLPSCEGHLGRCFEIAADPMSCTGTAHQRVHWRTDVAADRFVIECEVE